MADEEPTHLTTTEARGGTAPKAMRTVLLTSIVLVVVFLAIIVAAGWMS